MLAVPLSTGASVVIRCTWVGNALRQFRRSITSWTFDRIFPSYEAILDHCCAAWNKLTDQPWRVMSIGWRDGDHGF